MTPISAQNVVLPHLGADLRPEPVVGTEALTAGQFRENAVCLREAVAENRSRRFATLTMIAAFTSGIDLTQFEPLTKETENA